MILEEIAYEPCNTLSNTFQNPCELPRIYNSWCPVQTLFPSLYSLQIGGGRRPLLGWMSTTLLPAPYPRLNVFVTSESLHRLRSYFCLQLPVRLNQHARAPPKPRLCAGGQHMLPYEGTPDQVGGNLAAGGWETGSA